jgi:hypothetical protein
MTQLGTRSPETSRILVIENFAQWGCGPQKLRADTPYAAYPLDLITTLQRLMRWPVEEVTHCSVMGPLRQPPAAHHVPSEVLESFRNLGRFPPVHPVRVRQRIPSN